MSSLKIFYLTVLTVFITIFVESINLLLQLKSNKLSEWFGRNAFKYHLLTTIFCWLLTFSLIIILQFKAHPLFHSSIFLKYTGVLFMIGGSILSIWGFIILGIKRSLCLNFFKEGVPIVKSSIYKYIKNPEDYGLWLALLGLAFFTGSLYNLVIALEFVVLMIPHMIIENIPLGS